MTEITKTKPIVKALLENYATLRDNDERLICNVWLADLARNGLNMKCEIEVFFNMFASGDITNADTITRVRRKLQEEHKHLRGKLWAVRHGHQEEVQKELGYKIK